jgi:hypothetical protein
MALIDKNIVITPNKGQTADPKIAFTAANAGSSSTITLNVYTNTNGTLSFEGSAGQLFSISNSFTGTIFSVNDVSGIPSIEVLDTGQIKLAQYGGYVSVLGTTNATSTATGILQVAGGVGIGRDLYVGGTIYGSVSVSGIISTATNLAGGSAGQFAYQTGAGATSFISTASMYVGNSAKVDTVAQTGNATYYPTFVDANNAIAATEIVYTTSSFVINPSTGNVGIGMSNPSYKLHVTGDIGVTSRMYIGSSGTAGQVQLLYGSVSQWAINSGLGGLNNFNITDILNSAERLRIDASGNVGIATTSPASKLHVAGDARITGITTVTNTTQASSTITGALQVVGGAGIGGNLYVGGEIVAQKLTIEFTTVTTTLVTTDDVIKTTNNTNATSTITGALQVTGGAGIGRDLYVGGNVNVSGTINATVTGVITTATNLAGGLAGQFAYQTGAGATSFISTASMYVGRALTADSVTGGTGQVNTIATSTNATYFLTFVDANNATATAESFYTTSSFTVNAASGGVRIGGVTTVTNTTAATSTNTGALQVAGGVGIGGNLYAVGQIQLLNVSGGVNPLVISASSNPTQIYRDGGDIAISAGASYSLNGSHGGIRLDNNGGATITGGLAGITLAGSGGNTVVTQSTATSSTATGAFRVVGGVGIGGGLVVGGITTVTNTTAATSTVTGALQVIGGVGIGKDLWVGGTAYANILQSTSDVNFKKDIVTITDALDTVMQLRGVEYKWKVNDEPSLGLVAQEVQKIVPAAVSQTGDRLTVAYGNLIGLLVEAIKEQQYQIVNLQKEIQELKR